MGLDITVYKNLQVVDNPQLDEDGELLNYDTEWKPGASMEWSEKYFPGRGEGIEPNKVYSWDVAYEFEAGSYSGYNWWREKLKEFAEGDQFKELIDFADNEGVIGFVVAEKLYKDFKENRNRAKEYSKTLDDGEYWFSKYLKWEEAFEKAKEHGAVEFG